MLKKLSIILISLLALGNASASTSTKVKPLHTCTQKDSTTLALSCLLYREARSQDHTGMMLVGNVVVNRYRSKKYPNSIKKIIFQDNQFSHSDKELKILEKEPWEQAKKIAKYLISVKDSQHLYIDLSQGSEFFFSGKQPTWAKSLYKNFKYKDHIFLKEDYAS